MNGKFVAYYRVSTTKQGIHGLGMEAQRTAVQAFLNGGNWELIAEFAEVESGKRNQREELQKALALCKRTRATLLIAKLDRLSRNAAFLLNLQESGVKFQAVDLPVDSFLVGIMALVAQKEREMISERTKAGLAAAKKRGARLGNPNPARALLLAKAAKQQSAKKFADALAPVIQQIKKSGMTSLRQIAFCLNARGYKTARGCEFKAESVRAVLAYH